MFIQESTPYNGSFSLPSSHPLSEREKKVELVGMSTFERPSFQTSLERQDTTDPRVLCGSSKAVLRSAVPYLGKYDKTEFTTADPLVLFKLPPEIVQKVCPYELSQEAAHPNVESYYMVHSQLPNQTFNVLFHGWVYEDKPAGYCSGPYESIHQTRAAGLDGMEKSGWRGLSVSMFSPSIVHAHDFRCSPNNLTLKVTDLSRPLIGFWSAVKKSGKCLLTRHLIVNDPVVEEQLKRCVAVSQTVEQLLTSTQQQTPSIYTDMRELF